MHSGTFIRMAIIQQAHGHQHLDMSRLPKHDSPSEHSAFVPLGQLVPHFPFASPQPAPQFSRACGAGAGGAGHRPALGRSMEIYGKI